MRADISMDEYQPYQCPDSGASVIVCSKVCENGDITNDVDGLDGEGARHQASRG